MGLNKHLPRDLVCWEPWKDTLVACSRSGCYTGDQRGVLLTQKWPQKSCLKTHWSHRPCHHAATSMAATWVELRLQQRLLKVTVSVTVAILAAPGVSLPSTGHTSTRLHNNSPRPHAPGGGELAEGGTTEGCSVPSEGLSPRVEGERGWLATHWEVWDQCLPVNV